MPPRKVTSAFVRAAPSRGVPLLAPFLGTLLTVSPASARAIFVDAGKVVSDHDDTDFEDLVTGYGLGFRFHSRDAVVFRLDLANSREGLFPLFRYRHVF